ncbi:MAG: hypothetical protein IID36_13785, partial [Planctomycetes bacterium]|nr:hypothetical protein [Planctomycetota bacterium]
NSPSLVDPPIESGFAFTNFSTTLYAALQIRPHDDADAGDFAATPLLPPGVTHRVRFLDSIGVACPDSLDLRVLLYRRVNDDVPIGLDEGETIEPEPVAAGEILDVPACNVQTLATYTIVNWDAEDGTARVKLAQGTAIEQTIRDLGLFPNVDAAWEIEGVDPALAQTAPPEAAEFVPLAGRVVLPDGTGVSGIGVLVRTRFRVRLDDDNTENDPDAGFGDPIVFTLTDEDGAFSLDRPAGAYRVEFFADDFAFRPAVLDVESPAEDIIVVVEAL